MFGQLGKFVVECVGMGKVGAFSGPVPLFRDFLKQTIAQLYLDSLVKPQTVVRTHHVTSTPHLCHVSVIRS